MSEVKVNKISPRTNCGTVTLGDSGDTITIPSGVTITNSGTAAGFGSTGEVSWNTTKITADPGNAVSGVGYFTDTSGGAFNVTLPSSPSAGNVVAVADYANTWDTNNLTIARNGSNIEGAASDFVCNQEGASITFVYVDATKGWVVTNTGNSSQAFEARYVTATGGTITTSGNFKIHTLTGPGTFCVSCAGNSGGSNTVSYMVIAGGGGGGYYNPGAGAGGYREGKASTDCYTASPLNAPSGLPVSVQGYPITVGGGGPGGGPPNNPGTKGNNSVFSTITSTGGGFGGGGPANASNDGGPGGSGGSGAPRNPIGGNPPGTGNTPPVSPPQGNNGGQSHHEPGVYQLGGGGGGAGGAGASVAPTSPGATAAANGGDGVTSCITASPVTRAGGGGGGSDNTPRPAGNGGSGGGGNGGGPGASGSNGTTNTGGGGGGSGSGSVTGGTGGSGIVVIRYKFQ